jgi:hypothetical protein
VQAAVGRIMNVHLSAGASSLVSRIVCARLGVLFHEAAREGAVGRAY